ncbi:MAG: T9SS type A sorting domain-containing protein [Paludibacter sp.]|nr:T9SS type A sorting domain-containing protein [Paludibacter sp.]
MKKITLKLFYFAILALYLFNPAEVKANYIPGDFNSWAPSTSYSTSFMPSGYEKYTVQASDDNQFKLLMWADNWTAGWGSGYWINSWNVVWNLDYVSTGLGNAFVKSFGTSQFMTVITSTSLSGATSKFGFLKTSATPINISLISGGTTNVNLNTSVAINITLNAAKCAEEFILIRYTTDDWSTSSFVTATGSGTSYSAIIPAQTSNKTVKWYALSSTLSAPITDTDYLTLSVMNNTGSNYSYFTGESAMTDYFRSITTGNWGDVTSWESSSNGSSNWISATLVPGSSAASITILSGHNITLNQDATIPGLTINSGGTFTASDTSPHTLTISKSTSGSSTTLSNSGTWANGTGGSTVIFTGAPSSGDAVHAVSGSIAFQNVTINKTDGINNVGASFSENSSLTGTLEIGSGGFISTAPPTSFYGSSAILKFNQGSGASYDVNSGGFTWSTSVIPNNITISSGTVNLNDNRTTSGDLIIETGATLNINAAKQLTVSTSLTNNGTMNLLSDASGTATILTPGTSNIVGTFKVQQYLSSARNWYISSPVTGATVPTGKTYFGYQEPGDNVARTVTGETDYWKAYAATSGLTVGKGYIAQPTEAITLEFTGTALNNGNIPVSLTRTTGKTKEGFNLIGNPYPSHITWTTDLATSANVNSTIWYRTYNSGYTFQTYNAAGTIGAPIETTPYIPPMQGFWVRVNTVAGGTLTFTNAMRYHKSSNPLKATSTTNNVNKILRLEVSNGTNKDETVVYSNDNALDTYDTYDSSKFPNSSDSYPEIYTVVGSEQLVINGMSSLPINTVIPLGFKSLKKGLNSFSMKASQFSNFDSDIKIVLKDVENTSNPETNISDGTPYTFTSDSITTESRFSIIFKSISGTTALNSEMEDNIVIYKNADNHISVKTNNNIEGNINVYNSLGQKVIDKPMTGNLTIIENPLKAGIYIVTVKNSVKTSAKQVVIF